MIQLLVRGVRKLYFQVIKHFRKVISVKTAYGTFRIHTHDQVVSYQLYKDRQWEIDTPREYFEFIRKHITAEKLYMVDLGANIGVTSIPYVHFGWVEQSIAVEANEDNFKLLQENVILNNLSDRIFPLHYAATESTSELIMEKSEENSGDHRVRMTDRPGALHEERRAVSRVKGEPLQNLVRLAPVDLTGKTILVWIDIQGHEGYCFRGAKDWLRATKAIAIAELWPYGILRADMSLEVFEEIVASIWSHYYRHENNQFVKHPISDLRGLLKELEPVDRNENIILVP
jgi:FkbM family methyltransferase